MFHVAESLILGISAWVLGGFAILRPQWAYRLSVSSFTLCIASVLFQLIDIKNRVNTGDFAGVADTIHAVLLGACVLIVITLLLNTIALVRAEKKQTNP